MTRTADLPGLKNRYLIDSADTDGRFALIEHRIPPRTLAAPMHMHEREDEYSYVLSGRMGAQIGDEIDGWKVSQIEGRKVVLSLDGRFATFTLFSDDRGKSESVGGSAPVGEPKNTQRQMQAQQNSPQVAAAQSVQPKKRRRSRE